MRIQKKYLRKYLHDIAIDQIAEEYRDKGYTIAKEEMLGKFRADLIAIKDNEKIVIEVKTGKMDSSQKEQIAGIADYIRNKEGYKFLVAVATPPKEKAIEIENIEALITDHILSDLPLKLDGLSTHTRPDEVSDIDIDEVSISGTDISVKGNGVIDVELQMGSDGDQDKGHGFKTSDKFPFEFAITLERDNVNTGLKIKKVDALEVDTSSY
jgi:hypothetical protein